MASTSTWSSLGAQWTAFTPTGETAATENVDNNQVPEAIEDTTGDEQSEDDEWISRLKKFKFSNVETVMDLATNALTGQMLDDKTYLMERIVALASELPVTSRNSQKLTYGFLGQLWGDLEHPPQSWLGHEYAYRRADGSGNNMLWPHIGAAGTPYARTVKAKKMQPIDLPDPDTVFDSILKRKEFRPHPNKISSVLFYVASVIIHDIFHTSHEDFTKSETSSYLDLSPLYGNSDVKIALMRTKKGGRIKPDCFADMRILGFPPGVGLLLIMFNRFHNHVVEQLALIDEKQRFSSILNPPAERKCENPEGAYDEALFQTGRLITCGLYINIIMKDYVRTILNLNRTNSTWNLDPRSNEGKSAFGSKTPEATGNQCAAEFNLVYRWHSTVSQRDQAWSEQAVEHIMKIGKEKKMSDDTNDLRNFMNAIHAWASTIPKDPVERQFENYERDSTGKMNDAELAQLWRDCVDDVAGSFGAHHVPECLRQVEVLGMIQSRSWNLASLNEFREYFKLQPHKTFEDINPDPEVADQLKRLYGHPDNVEIYPGIVVENAKEPYKPGSGLCTNFTISRAILADAVALVRGDRFYTIDYTPKNLTNWGFTQAGYDSTVNQGCVFYKLVLNAFPNDFAHNSIYAHYPLTNPEENKKIMTDLGRVKNYTYEATLQTPVPVVCNTYDACKAILSDKNQFISPWQSSTAAAPKLKGRFSTNMNAVKTIYSQITNDLLEDAAYRVADWKQVDIVKDIINPAHITFINRLLPMPLSMDGKTTKKLTVQEVVDAFGLIAWKHHPEAVTVGRRPPKAVAKKFTYLVGNDETTIRHLPDAADMLVTFSRLCTHSINFYLGEGKKHLPAIKKLASQEGDDADEELQGYFLEGCRLSLRSTVVRKAVAPTKVPSGGADVQVQAGQRIICDLTTAHSVSKAEKTGLADQVKIDTDPSSYLFLRWQNDLCPEPRAMVAGLTALFKAVMQLEGVRSARGSQGVLKTVKTAAGLCLHMDPEYSQYDLLPHTMKIEWDL